MFVRWFAEHDTTCALQRPDFYLYGTAPTAATATSLLADLRHHLAQGATAMKLANHDGRAALVLDDGDRRRRTTHPAAGSVPTR